AGAAVSPDNRVRRLAEQITAATVTPIVGADQAEALNDFSINAKLEAATHLGEVLVGRDVVGLERTRDTGNVEMKARTGVKSDFGDDVREQVRRAQGAARGVVQLAADEAGQRGGRYDLGAACLPARVLVGV